MVNENSFISVNEILSDVTLALDDAQERKLNHGYYVNKVKRALDALGFETAFYTLHTDVAIPSNHIISIPSNVYRIKSLHVFKGTPDNIETQENVYWKKGARNLGGKGKGFTANMYPGSNDIYYGNNLSTSSDSVYWCIFNNGNIILSDACDSFDYLRIVFDGIVSGSLDVARMVPPEVREAVVLWVVEKCASILKVRYPQYRAIQADAAAQLDEFGMNGAWQQAKRNLKYMGKKLLRDTLEYNNRPRA